MRTLTNGKLQVSLQNFKNATKGEVDKALNEALKSAGHNLTLSSLHCEKQRNGEAIYRHPITNETVITVRNHKQSSFSKHGDWNAAKRDWDSITFHQIDKILTVFNPKGHIASRIKTSTVGVEGLDSVEAVSSIKEYYPPSKKQLHAGESHISKTRLAEEFRAKDRLRSQERKIARQRKREIGQGIPGLAENNGTAHNNGDGMMEKPSAKPQVRGLQGKLRREREFNIPDLMSCMYRGNIPDKSSYMLKRRMASDVIRHRNGHYTAIQYSGDYYNVVEYDSTGARLEQTVYNNLGEAVRNAGESKGSRTLPKVRRPEATDRDGAERAEKKMLTREGFELSRVQNEEDAWEVGNKLTSSNGALKITPPAQDTSEEKTSGNTLLSDQIAKTIKGRVKDGQYSKWGNRYGRKNDTPLTYYPNDPSRTPRR